MFKVECESCKSPFQIDERRVPPAGLKMRCPKCGHSFLVASPGADLPAAKPVADLPAAKPAAPAKPPFGRPAPAPPIAPPPGARLDPQQRPKNPLKQTMVGVGGGDAGFTPQAPAVAAPRPAGLPAPINVPPPAPQNVHSTPTIAAKPPPSTMAAMKRTMVGVAPAAPTP